MEKFFGKYRAKVLDNKDPKKMGRLKVSCPTIYGDYESPWCLPCLPTNIVSIPKVGASVWVEFEEGSTQLPIWVGVWWKENTLTDTKLDEKVWVVEDLEGEKEATIKKNLEVKEKATVLKTITTGSSTVNGNIKVNQGKDGGGNIVADGTVTAKNI